MEAVGTWITTNATYIGLVALVVIAIATSLGLFKKGPKNYRH